MGWHVKSVPKLAVLQKFYRVTSGVPTRPMKTFVSSSSSRCRVRVWLGCGGGKSEGGGGRWRWQSQGCADGGLAPAPMIELGFGVSGVEFVTDGLEEVGGGRWVGGARGGGAGQHRGSQGGGAWSHVKEDQRGVAMVTGKKKRVTRCYTRPKVLHKSTLLEHFLKLSFAVAPTLPPSSSSSFRAMVHNDLTRPPGHTQMLLHLRRAVVLIITRRALKKHTTFLQTPIGMTMGRV
jgi:hypothetical protein